MKKSSKQKENNIVKKIIENKYYILVVLIVLILTITTSFIVKNSLSNSEKIVYEIVDKNKNEFKNPKSLKVVSAKVCSDDYSIIRITANNSFGAEVTTSYYSNKGTLVTNNEVAKAVVEECFKKETSDYNSVQVLSKESLKKINKKLDRE